MVSATRTDSLFLDFEVTTVDIADHADRADGFYLTYFRGQVSAY